LELILNSNMLFFIEESILIEDGFIDELRKIIESSNKNKYKIRFLFDNNTKDLIKTLASNNNVKKSYLLDGTIDILNEYKLYEEIETNSYLEMSLLEKELKKGKNSTIYFLTQKENIFNSLKVFKDKYNCKFYKYYGTFEEWLVKTQKLDAFYLEEDSDYIPKVETKGIKYVYSPKYGYLKLDLKTEKSGGEGSVFKTYNNLMAKIYKPESITYVNFKKLSAMIDMNLFNPNICWPKDLLYYDNNFVGFLMDEIDNAEPLLTMRLENFSSLSHLERFILCYNMLKNIKYLHDKGILVGDLKPDNILVKNKNEVFFIDCGCYQIDDYACPVCHPEYTKRVFKKDEIKKQLRLVEDEYYPINKMAFEILIRKNHTYSPDNLDIENQDKNQFYYPLNVNGIKPQTEDMAIWCFLTQPMREYFYYYFKDGRITDLGTWCNELKIFIDKMMTKMNS